MSLGLPGIFGGGLWAFPGKPRYARGTPAGRWPKAESPAVINGGFYIMSMTDPVADMLTRIRNANALMREEVVLPSTAIKLRIAEVLRREGFIENFEIRQKALQNDLAIKLRYGSEGEKVIRKIVRVSRPGCRVYRGALEIPRVLNGQGIAVISTNQGVLSDRECRDKKIGGEVLCLVS